MAADTVRNLNTHYGRLAISTQRLSSGLRINGAADDAAGLAIRELMRADIAALHQGVRNANDAISMIQVVDGALGIIDEKLIRMKELAEQAATGTYDSTQRLMIDSEFQAMASEIQRIATATDFNGIKLLDGEKGKKLPSDISLNTPITNIQQTSSSTTTRSQGGQTYLDEHKTTSVLTTEEVIEYNLHDDKLYKTVKTNTTESIIKEYNRLCIDCDKDNISAEFYNEFSIYGSQHCENIGLVNDNAYDIVNEYNTNTNAALDYNMLISSSYIYEQDTTIYANAWPNLYHCYFFDFDLNNDGQADVRWNINLDTYKDIDWVKDNVKLISFHTWVYPWNSSTTTGPTVTTTHTEEIQFDNINEGITIHFGPMNDSSEDYYDIEKRDCTLKGLGLEDVRIETQDKAQEALVTINDAIVKKDQARAYYGAMQNRLENTVSNLTIQAENLQASESRISDVDVATEMTNFVRNQILTKSAVAMLSQANSMPQMAMQLIGG